MNFDYFTVAALVDEFNEILAGGRVQDILEIDDVSLGLEIYNQNQRHYLFLSADPNHARAHLTPDKLRRGVMTPSPLGLQLTRYIEGARLMAVRQPTWERILIFDFMTEGGEYTLIFEPIERRSNIVLVENGTIMECIRRVSGSQNRVRQLQPGKPYQLPPPQNQFDPTDLTPEVLASILQPGDGSKAFQLLTRRIQGLSPTVSREIVYRAIGNSEATQVDPQAVYNALPTVLDPLLDQNWESGYLVKGEQVTGFAAFKMTFRDEWVAADSMSAAIEKYYGATSGEEAYTAAKKPIQAQLQAARKRLKGKLHSLKRQQREESDVEQLRQSGELLLAYQYQLKKGATHFEAQYEPDAPALKIKLDPLLSPVDNAQKYFAKYEKAKRSRRSVPDMLEATQQEIDYLNQIETDLALANNWTEIGEIQNVLIEEGYWRGTKRRQTTGRSAPRKVTFEDGTVIWIGRNSQQNEDVTFQKGAPEDIWMHARGVPGSHVIVKMPGNKTPSQSILNEAAAYAAYYSKGRGTGKVEVIVTERKHIRKIKGGKPGMVRMMQQTHDTILAEPKPVANDG